MMTYTTGGADSLWLWLTQRLFLMECVEQRQETGQKPKCENGFSIICGFILVVEEEASLVLGVYSVYIEDVNDFPAVWYGDFEVVQCDSTPGAVWWPRAAVQCDILCRRRLSCRACCGWHHSTRLGPGCVLRPGLSSGNHWYLLPVSYAQRSQIFRLYVWGLLFALGFEEKWKPNVCSFITFWVLNCTNIFDYFSTIIWILDLFLLSAYCF